MASRRPPKRDIHNMTGRRVGLYCRVSQADRNDPDREREKSTQDQEAVGRKWVEQRGAVLVDVYSDEGISASRFTTKQRQHFARLLADIEAGELDVVWFWELSRVSRRPAEFYSLQELCRDNGVVWVNQDRVVDPDDYKDMLQSGILSIVDATSSEQTSERVKRGMESIALAGRPAGSHLYGYRRTYDPVTRKLERVEPNVYNGDGTAAKDSPAAVVREVFRRLAAGDALTRIANDLNDREIPVRRSGRYWRATDIRAIAMNPAYIARRVHQAKERFARADVHKAILEGVETVWPPLVDEDTFWAVHRVLTDPARKTTRPAAAQSLLSFLVTCAKCGGDVKARRRRHQGPTYSCQARGCVGIHQEKLNDYVEEVMIRWLSDPAVFAELTKIDDSAAAAEARADANRAQVELSQWRQAAEAGEITLTGYASAEKGLLARIAEADKRAHEATVPPALAGRIGPEAEKAWRLAGNDIKRQMIQAVADIAIKPAGRGQQQVPTIDRVEWRWLIGPDTDQDSPGSAPSPFVTPRAHALLELARHGPLEQKELLSRVGITKSGIGKLVKRLVDNGLVLRGEYRAGGTNSPLLTLTAAGQEAAAALDGEET